MTERGEDRMAFIVSRFPTISETFIVRELRQLQDVGLTLDLYALVRHEEPFEQHDTLALAPRVVYGRWWSVGTLRAQLRWLRTDPRRYLGTWRRVITGNRDSVTQLLRALFIVPVAASFALRMADQGVTKVHAHWLTYGALTAHVIHRLTGIPYSVTGHAHDVYEHHSFLPVKLAAADRIIVCVENCGVVLRERYGDEIGDKVVVNRHGVELDVYQPAPEPDPPGHDPLRIVCVGSLVPFKGHSVLLGALSVLTERGLAVDCRFIGDGKLRTELEDGIGGRGLADTVRLEGAQPLEVVRDWMRWAHVVVHPGIELATGRKDGVPNVLIEALALRRPVIASALPGIMELIDDGVHGALFPPGESRALADRLLDLTEQPESYRAMAARGRKRITAEYDAVTNGHALYQILTSRAADASPKGTVT